MSPKKDRVIPEHGEVDPATLHSHEGNCYRKECGGKRVSRLLGHYKRYHGEGATGIIPLKIIPADRVVTREEIHSEQGICAICNGTTYRHLRQHFDEVHVAVPKRNPMAVKVIPPTGDLEVRDVHAGPGECFRDNCNGTHFCDLRQHFRGVHKHETEECPICHKAVSKGSITIHLKTHTGPAKCSECAQTSPSLCATKSHIWKRHKDVSGVQPLLLSGQDLEDYKLELELYRQEVATRQGDRNVIKEVVSKLKFYERRLADPTDTLYIKAQALKLEFDKLFDFPGDPIIAKNSSFISVWNLDTLTPQLVFELVEKKKTKSKGFFASQFARDPKIGLPSQPHVRDYAKRGYHRGHLSSAANFEDKWMVLPTYYYPNIIPMHPTFNLQVRLPLERFIRDKAKANGIVAVAHFPLFNGPRKTIGLGVCVPSSVATVMIEKKKNGNHITAWELPHSEKYIDYSRYECDPFALFKKANIVFKCSPDNFVYVSSSSNEC